MTVRVREEPASTAPPSSVPSRSRSADASSFALLDGTCVLCDPSTRREITADGWDALARDLGTMTVRESNRRAFVDAYREHASAQAT